MTALAACGDDGPVPADAAVPDAAADGSLDAAPDAGGPCPGQVTFTGEYVDFDSTPDDFMGIFDATLTEVGAPENTATTAPNGRATLCLPAGDSQVTFTHDDYVPARFSVHGAAAARGPFSLPGLQPARLAALAGAHGLSVDPEAAQVLVEVRSFPGEEPVTGARVELDAASDGAFTADPDGDYVPGDTLTDGAHVLLLNVAAVTGSAAVTVTPPEGVTCIGRDEIVLAAGELAATTYACER